MKLTVFMVITVMLSSFTFVAGLAINAPDRLKPASIVADFHRTCIPIISYSVQGFNPLQIGNGFQLIPNWTTANREKFSVGYSKQNRDEGYVTLVSEPISVTNSSVVRCTFYASSGDAASIRQSMITLAGSDLQDTVFSGDRTMTWIVYVGAERFSLQFIEYASGADSNFSLAAFP